MKARLEAARYLTWKACDYFDRTSGAGTTPGYDPLAAVANRPQPS
jgi:hypothetical protein